jgi:hypothetical protein
MIRLEKVYATLSETQKFAVGMAAVARDDMPEVLRVLATASRKWYSLGSLVPAAWSFDAVGMRHLVERLEIALRMDAAMHVSQSWWYEPQLEGRSDEVPVGRAGGRDAGGGPADTARHPDRAVRLNAYLLLSHRDGWSEFLTRLRIDPELGDRLIPAGNTLRAAEKLAGKLAMSEAETREMVLETDPNGAGKVVTAAGVADRLQQTYEELLASWGQDRD